MPIRQVRSLRSCLPVPNVTFGGTGATTDVRAITVAKGAIASTVELNATNFTVLGVNTDSAGFLTLTSGTFKISGTFTVVNRVFTAAGYTIPAAGGFWLNNPNFTVAGQNGSPTNSGLLRISSGIYNVGTSAGNSLGGGTGAVFTIEGGTLNTAGRLQTTSAVTYNQSGGDVNVCTVGNTATTACFGLTSTANTFNMSGGNITLVLPSTSATPLDYSVSTSTAVVWVTNPALTTLNVGTGAAAETFRVLGSTPNLNIPLNKTMAVGSGTAGGAIFHRGATVVNNGAIVIQGTGASSRFDWAASGPMTYSGSGTFGTLATPFAGVGMSANSPTGNNATINSPIIINRVNFFNGGFTNSGQITLGGGAATTTVIQVGNSTTATNAGSFDVSPVHNAGSGGHILLHLRATTINWVTGFEVNTTRTLTQLTVDNNAVGGSLTIAGGPLTVTSILALTNGVVNTTAANLLTNNAATTTRTTGYVDGPLARNMAVGSHTFFVGDTAYSPVVVNTTALGAPTIFTAEAIDAPMVGLIQGQSLSRYWNLTEAGDITADLSFTYAADAVDVNGIETDYRIYKNVGGVITNMCPGGPCVSDATNTLGPLVGVTDFSSWSGAENAAVDTNAPDTTILTQPNNPINSSAATFTFSGTDTLVGIAGFECRIDAGAWAPCTSPKTYTGLADGSHTFDVRAVDTASNPDPTPATYTWVIDTVAPDTSILTNPTNPTTNTNATFTFSGTDAAAPEAVASFECRLDGGMYAACTSPQNYVALALGSHTFDVRAIDTAGNVDASPASFAWTINPVGPTGPVSVTATAGTPGPTAYPTLKDAFDAINAGTHQGAVSVLIVTSTTETASAVLNNSGAGSANYTSVLVRPNAVVSVTGNIVGAIIKLNGADNVTIDGRIGGVGTNRDLTVSNSSTSAATAAIWLASVAAGNGASNNTIRNLELAGGTDTSASANSTFGIIMCGTTISTTANGVDNDNNAFIANRIVKVRYGIVTRGTTTDLNINPVVTDNIVGPNAFGTDQINKVGIFMQADTGALVSRNTIQFVGCLDPQACSGADRMGIGIGQESWSMTPGTLTSNNYTVTRNVIHDIVEETTFSSVGINLATTGGTTNNLVANNFIYNVRANGTVGDQAVGLGIAGGLGDRVVFNSISMTGDVDPGVSTATSNFGSGIRVGNASGATHGNLTLSNNSVYMDLSSTSTAAARYYAISGNAAGYNWGTGGENHNNYYINPINTQLQTGGLGTVSGNTLTTQFATLANWQTAYTTPAAQDANSIQADPQHVSTTGDLHIAVASPNVDAGLSVVGVTRDIDNQSRVAAPDIGADEPSGVTPPANDIETTLIIAPANSAVFTTGATSTPQARFTNVGSATQTSRQVTFTITGPGGYNYSNMQTIPSIAVDEAVNVIFATTPAFAMAGTYTMTASTAADSNTANDSAVGTFSVVAPFNGSYNVGTAETFTSLTNPGGIFAGINSAGATGNITINITSDLAGETGAVALNEIAGGFTVLIKPTGAARTISGAAPAAGGLLGFSSTDGVTIDGSLSASTDRSLTIIPSNAANNGGGIYFASGANGTQNNVVKNVNVYGNGSTTGVLLGVAFAGSTFGGLGVDNDNNRIENCDIRGAFYGIASLGASAANKDTGTVITKNIMSGTGATGIGRVGIYIIFADGAEITQNNIASVSNPGSVDTIGIAAGSQGLSSTPLATGGISNATISRNYVGVVSNNATFSSAGIVVASDTTGTNNVVNNMVTGVTGNANAGDIVAGIYVNGLAGSTQNIYHNSVSMTGDRLPVTANMLPSYALAIATDQPTNVVNNVLVNSQTRTGSTGGGGESYAIGFDGPAANVNLLSNTNDLFVSGPIGVVGITGDLTTAAQTTTAGTGTNQATLVAWQTATTEDGASISADPLFTSTTDLHIPAGSPLVNIGTDVMVTTDFDGQTRDAMRHRCR
ncbi:MAG: hypothetical protein IPK01_14345 [Acidobacteria bacterium]|nr:hypothetical protein [Acidobacteriota bacterium]